MSIKIIKRIIYTQIQKSDIDDNCVDSLLVIIICENISQVILFVKENTRLVIYATPPDSFVRVQRNADNSEITPIGTKGNVVCAEKPFQNEEELCVRLSSQKAAGNDR